MAQRQSKKQKEENREWKTGQKCEIYDQLKKGWVKGEVVEVFKDEEGEWVKVKYGRITKELPPDSPEIRVSQKKKKMDSVQGWKVGNQCELYNRAMRQWVEGEIITIFTNQMGDWLRVQSGQRIHDVLSADVEHDVKPRGASSMNLSVEDIQTIKNIATKHRSIAPILNRIFAKSDQFVSSETIKSYVVAVK